MVFKWSHDHTFGAHAKQHTSQIFKITGISKKLDGSDYLVDDQIPYKNEDELQGEVVKIQFDNIGEDSDCDFERFSNPNNDK